MLFNSLPFVLFLAVVCPLYWLLPQRRRLGFLTAASLVFYAMWIPQYVLLLLGILAINYVLLLRIQHSTRPRIFVTASIVFSLAVLAYFKYAGFLVQSWNDVSPTFGIRPAQPPDILLPLGISFFTFQVIGLAVDAYRHRGTIASSFREYVLFISFFPHQIAGPILRGWNLLPQFRASGVWTPERAHRAAWLLCSGLTKKVVLADTLLAPYVNFMFGLPDRVGGAGYLLGVYSFAFQVYYDFSGYTDIARGLALLFGFELPANFREPYLARNPAEYWHRWHITLSQWLRDYLYIPLGGNRAGVARTYVNLLITMLLGGIWHGAGWNFAVWGALQGLLLIGHRAVGSARAALDDTVRLADLPRIVATFHAICFGYVFFRANSLADALRYLQHVATGDYVGHVPVFQALVVLTCAMLHPVERWMRINGAEIRSALCRPWWAVGEGLAMGVCVGLAAFFGGFGGAFIYFQF